MGREIIKASKLIIQVEKIHLATVNMAHDKQMSAWGNFDNICSKVLTRLKEYEIVTRHAIRNI